MKEFILIIARSMAIFLWLIGSSMAQTKTMNEVAKLVAMDGTNSRFGFSIAIDGDTALIGTSSTTPFVYVFVRRGNNWEYRDTLVASDGSASFGYSVDIRGDTAIIGARYDSAGGIGGTQTGAAYVFQQQGDRWIEQAKLVATDAQSFFELGKSVAVIDAHTVMAGAVGADRRGAVYIFEREVHGWNEVAKLTASDRHEHDAFGWSLSATNGTVAIGAAGAENNLGAVYIFKRKGEGWSEKQKLTVHRTGCCDSFGWSLGISREALVVGAPYAEVDGLRTGVAYVYGRQGGKWVEHQRLTASDAERLDDFGYSVAIDGKVIVVTAPWALMDINENSIGAAYVFHQQGGDWNERFKLLASDGSHGDYLGRPENAAAVGAGTVLIGSISHQGAGAVYLFDSSPAVLCGAAAPGAGSVARGRAPVRCP